MTEADPQSFEASLGIWPVALLTIYSLLIVGASLAGGWVSALLRLSHTRMQILISLVGGLMLGIGVFHMLPHAIAEFGAGGADKAAIALMAGLVTMFFLLRAFHFHHHGPADFAPLPDDDHPHQHDDGHAHPPGHGHDHAHSHAHAHSHEGGHADGHSHDHGGSPAAARPHSAALRYSWMGVLVGLGIHTLIDGMSLAASLHADALHGRGPLCGLGTFLAILLHKPLDAVSITSLMLAGGWSPRARTAVNAGFALMCPLGAGLFLFGATRLGVDASVVTGSALAFAAGVFLCISLSDLLPEMEFHSHNRLPLSLALLAGIAIAFGVRWLEPSHAHSHAPPPSTPAGGVPATPH